MTTIKASYNHTMAQLHALYPMATCYVNTVALDINKEGRVLIKADGWFYKESQPARDTAPLVSLNGLQVQTPT